MPATTPSTTAVSRGPCDSPLVIHLRTVIVGTSVTQIELVPSGSMTRAFAKYEGLGNDFVVIESADVTASEAIRLCDRRHGIGADGVLALSTESTGEVRMRVVNADGSVPEMCGNGIRCVA